MEKKIKRKYQKPQVTRVKLHPDEAVLVGSPYVGYHCAW